MLVAEFNLPSPEEREARKSELEAEIAAAARGLNPDASAEEKVEDAAPEEEKIDDVAVPEEAETNVPLPSAPDLDALMEDD